MKSLEFIIPNALFDKIKEEAERLNVTDKLLIKAAIITFAENPSDAIKPLSYNYSKKDLTRIYLSVPKDIIEKIRLYASSKGFSIRRIVWSMVDDFLTLDDEKKKFYIDKVKRRLSRFRDDQNRLTKLQEAIAYENFNAPISASFKCNPQLYKLIEDEVIKKRTTISDLVRQAIEEFLKKYGNNYEEIKKLHETANQLFPEKGPWKGRAIKLPAYMLLQLTKISEQTSVPRSAIIRLAIMKHMNLLNKSTIEQQKVTRNEVLNDPPNDPSSNDLPQQNNKDELEQVIRFVNVPLPDPLYNLLKKYVMLKYNIDDERQIKPEVSKIVAKVLIQWVRRRFFKRPDIETYVIWQKILEELKTSLYPSLSRGTVVKKQDIQDAMKEIKDVKNITELFEKFKRRGYLKEIDKDNVKILLL